MIRAIRITACAAALLSSCYLLSQQPSSQDAPTAAARPVAAKANVLTLAKPQTKRPSSPKIRNSRCNCWRRQKLRRVVLNRRCGVLDCCRPRHR